MRLCEWVVGSRQPTASGEHPSIDPTLGDLSPTAAGATPTYRPIATGQQPTAPPSRGGMTLIELLVVIVLITTLVTTAIPVLSPGGDSRKIREGSRSVNAMLSGAQVRAVETGRPQGVAFKRLSADSRDPEDNGVCVEAYPVEVPPVYSGLDAASRVRVCRRSRQIGLDGRVYPAGVGSSLEAADTTPIEYQIQFVAPTTVPVNSSLPRGWTFDLVPERFFRPGDLIDIGGLLFVFVNISDRAATGEDEPEDSEAFVEADSSSDFFRGYGSSLLGAQFVVRPISTRAAEILPAYDSNGLSLPSADAIVSQSQSFGNNQNGSFNVGGIGYTAPFWTEPSAYKVYRQPTPASGDPVQLPAGVAIDLQSSGFPNGVSLYRPSAVWDSSSGANAPRLLTDPVVMMFSPEGRLDRARGLFDANGNQLDETLATTSLSLLVGRRELIPGVEADTRADSYSANAVDIADNPLVLDPSEVISDEQAEKWRDDYNWLNLNSRWVVVGAQSGSVTTVPNTFLAWRNPAELDRDNDMAVDLDEQLFAAREAVALRSTEGGR